MSSLVVLTVYVILLFVPSLVVSTYSTVRNSLLLSCYLPTSPIMCVLFASLFSCIYLLINDRTWSCQPPPLTCANDLASTAGSLAIVVSNLSSELHMLRPSYDLLSGEFTRTQNLLKAIMAAHCLGSTDEAWCVERQLQQDLNECVNSNIDLLQRLDNQNLVIASLRKKKMHKNAKMVLSAVRISMPYCI